MDQGWLTVNLGYLSYESGPQMQHTSEITVLVLLAHRVHLPPHQTHTAIS